MSKRLLDIWHSAFVLWLRRNLEILLVVAAFVSAIATYSVMTGSNAPLGIKPKRVLAFLIVDIAILTLLAGIIAMRIYSLWNSLRAGFAGSRLQKRILVLFSLVTITPTLIVSIFSVFFFNLGIQTWFNDRVQTAVQESLMVAEAYLAEHKENIRGDALAMANDLNQVANLAIADPAEFNRIVATQSALRLLTEAVVIQNNRIIAAGRLSFAIAFEHIPQDVFERADKGAVVLVTDSDDKVRALLRLEGLQEAYLLVGRLIDSKVLQHMENAQGAVNEYNTLREHLDDLQVAFSLVFATLALLLLLASVWYGMVFAARLTTPITSLVTAATRVRGGDFSARVEDSDQKDEIGSLSRAFNRMTEQLQAQRGELIDANRRLDERRRFSEAVLSGVSAGVIALDSTKHITLSNPSATAILNKVDLSVAAETPITDVLPGIHELLAQAEQFPGDVAQNTLTINNGGKTIALHVRVTVEKLESEIEGFIVTFDDITLLMAAQRNAAWADVARRVAHEIKNPLTPIQLAAERLKRKYLKFITEDQDSFVKYTDTITKNVGDIGRMVEEFVAFARLPTPKFATEDVSGIVRKAVFSAHMSNPAIDYRMDIPPGELTMMCDERQITQVLANLLKNAAEGIEAAGSEKTGVIGVRLACENDRITVVIEDNGVGFPPGEMQKMLEPYVTTRTKGTGLGLSIVKKIVEDHKGMINIDNIPEGGARVTLSFLQHCDINAAI